MANWRHELKYLCDAIELQAIEKRIQTIMPKDRFADDKGQYLIRSLYFDDYMKSCLKDNEDGNDPRYKWRIRFYNCSDRIINLEKKTKYREMTNKCSCRVTRELVEDIIGGNCFKYFGNSSLLDEFILECTERQLKPVMLGEYVRKPYIYREGNVRITFDCNISASAQFYKMFETDILKVPVLWTGYHVLEVKWDDFLPDIIYQLIENGHLVQSAFSKFYLGCNALEGRLF